MMWMWIVGPCLVAFVYVLAAKENTRRLREIEIWRKAMADVAQPARSSGKAGKDAKSRKKGPKRLPSLPGQLARALDALGGGELMGHYELVPKIAYLSILGSNYAVASDYQSVVAKLEAKAPAFQLRPVPMIDGVPAPNLGVQFTKDTEFGETFVVEPVLEGAFSEARNAELVASQGKLYKKWLSRPIRDALLDMPNVFLRVSGQTMTLTLYGAVDAPDIDRLVRTADVIFAEHGADGGPSLLGEDGDDEPVEAPKPAKSKVKTA
jgi:hypothetical protein